MPLLAFRGERAAHAGQKNGAVRLRIHITGLFQSGQCAVDRHVGHTQPARQIHHARLAQRGRKVGDGLDVILGDFRRPVPAGPVETFRRLRGGIAFWLVCGMTKPL